MPAEPDRLKGHRFAFGQALALQGVPTMLQISTGKFFKNDAYETLRRAIYYTNYRMFRDDHRIETPAGSLTPVAGVHGLGALTCEIIERIEKMPGGPYPGEVIATGGDTLINDFAAIISPLWRTLQQTSIYSVRPAPYGHSAVCTTRPANPRTDRSACNSGLD